MSHAIHEKHLMDMYDEWSAERTQTHGERADVSWSAFVYEMTTRQVFYYNSDIESYVWID